MSHLSATMKLAEYKQLFPARHCAHCQQFFVAARSDAKTCSNTCRVALSRRKRNPTPYYQKLKRDEEARARPRPQDTVIDYHIEAIGPDEAAAFIKRYEFLQTVGRSRARYGARNSSGELVGVAIFGTPSKLADGIIVLERGACAPWAHPHAASWFIRSSKPPQIMAGKSSLPIAIQAPEKSGPSSKRATGFTRDRHRAEPSTVRRERATISVDLTGA
jgi:hypothetical protein